MKLEHFEKILNEYRKGSDMISELHDIGIDLFEGKYKLSDTLYNLFESSLEANYSVDGMDWVTWFIFENGWGETDRSNLPVYRRNEFGVIELDLDQNRPAATDENGDPICYDIPSLWEFIEKNHKLI
jgi:hypothetical protein